MSFKSQFWLGVSKDLKIKKVQVRCLIIILIQFFSNERLNMFYVQLRIRFLFHYENVLKKSNATRNENNKKFQWLYLYHLERIYVCSWYVFHYPLQPQLFRVNKTEWICEDWKKLFYYIHTIDHALICCAGEWEKVEQNIFL